MPAGNLAPVWRAGKTYADAESIELPARLPDYARQDVPVIARAKE
jgi:hypothetical protein